MGPIWSCAIFAVAVCVSVIREGALDLNTALQFMEQITSALATAHRNDVIHRDLKPENILLDEDGNHYLADFGIAKDAAALGR